MIITKYTKNLQSLNQEGNKQRKNIEGATNKSAKV